MKDDRVYLEHIIECLDRIEEYVTEGREAFLEPGMLQDAVLRRLQTLAESTQRLSDARKLAHQGVPWREVHAFRNVVVHNYLGVDLDEVWGIVERHLEPLRQAASSGGAPVPPATRVSPPSPAATTSARPASSAASGSVTASSATTPSAP